MTFALPSQSKILGGPIRHLPWWIRLCHRLNLSLTGISSSGKQRLKVCMLYETADSVLLTLTGNLLDVYTSLTYYTAVTAGNVWHLCTQVYAIKCVTE